MYKTFIQLVLFFILIIIIFIIFKKYFYNENIIKKEIDISTLSIRDKEGTNENLYKKKIENEIINLTYEKLDKFGNKYLIEAKKGTLDGIDPEIINMNFVKASLTDINNKKLTIISQNAFFNKKNFQTTFSNNVKMMYQEQILQSDYLEFLIDKNIAIFKDNVKYNNQNIEAYANSVIIDLLTKEIYVKSKNQEKIEIIKKN